MELAPVPDWGWGRGGGEFQDGWRHNAKSSRPKQAKMTNDNKQRLNRNQNKNKNQQSQVHNEKRIREVYPLLKGGRGGERGDPKTKTKTKFNCRQDFLPPSLVEFAEYPLKGQGKWPRPVAWALGMTGSLMPCRAGDQPGCAP